MRYLDTKLVCGVVRVWEKNKKGEFYLIFMSYDVSFKVKVEGVEKYIPVGECYNYTFNVGTMIEEACGKRPPTWDNMKCSDLLPYLQKGIEELEKHPDEYKQYEPDNHWGSVEGAERFLQNVAKQCIEYPFAFVEVSC